MDSIFLIIKRHLGLAIAVFVFSMLSMVLVHTLSPPVYEVNASFYIQRQLPTQYQDREYDDMMDHIRILKSDLVLNPVIAKLKQDFPKRRDINQALLLKRLRADSNISGELNRSTKVVDLFFQDTDPRFATKVLDYTLQVYEDALAHIAQETRLKGAEFLKKRLAEVHSNRDRLSENLQRLEAASGTTDIELKNSELVKLKSSFVQLLGTVSAEVAARDRQIAYLQKLLDLTPQQVQQLATFKSDTKLESWQKQLAVERGELAKLKATYTDHYPGIQEKEEAVARLESLIRQRLQRNIDGNIQPAALTHRAERLSDMDVSLGKELIELSTQRSALVQQKAYYESYLERLGQGAKEVAFAKKDMTDLHFALNLLQSEEEKLQDKLQETVMEQASLLNLGSFVVLSPPLLPSKDDIVFPMALKTMLILGSGASLVLAVFSIGLAEFLDPKVILFERPGLTLGEFRPSFCNSREALYEELQRISLALSVLSRKNSLSSVILMDLFDVSSLRRTFSLKDDVQAGVELEYWSPDTYGKALAGVYASKCPDKKILFVSAIQSTKRENDLFNPFQKKILCLDKGQVQLYRSVSQANLYLLASNSGQDHLLDPYLLDGLQQTQCFDFTIIHLAGPDEAKTQKSSHSLKLQAYAALIEAVSDGVILGLSKSKSHVRQLYYLQQAVEPRRQLGYVVFP